MTPGGALPGQDLLNEYMQSGQYSNKSDKRKVDGRLNNFEGVGHSYDANTKYCNET